MVCGVAVRAGVAVSVALACVMPVRAFAQDAVADERAFTVCRACHQIGPGVQIAIGPVLNGVVGRKAGS